MDRDNGSIIAWHDVKKNKTRSPSSSTNTKTKMKVGELREFLSTRIPNEQLRGLKKPELEAMYEKEMSSPPDPSSDSETETTAPPKNMEEVSEPEPEPEPEQEQEPEPEPESIALGEMTDIEKQVVTDGGQIIGGINPDSPHECIIVPHDQEENSPRDQLLTELNSLKNSEKKKRARKSGASDNDIDLIDDAEDISQALNELIISLEIPLKMKQIEDPDFFTEDTDLDEDKSNYEEISHEGNFEEISHEGVDYLEDEETGNIYNMDFKLVGKWNENNDDIMWVSDDFRITHESKTE